AADRWRPGLGPQPRPPRHGRHRRVRERAHPARPPPAAPGERRLHTAHRLCRAGQLRAVFQRRVRQHPELHQERAEQYRQPGSAESAAMSATEAARAPQRPASLWALYLAFNRLALQGFGGVLAVAQRELVERLGWMTREEFVETLAIAQVLPGP
ncbi:Uncharacterized protein APZ42_002454, partial [Daphnia magna]